MSVSPWGKLLGGGVGLAVGGLAGAVLGAFAGHSVDRLWPRFGEGARLSRVLFELLGHMARLDGRVSEAEVAVAEATLDRLSLRGSARRLAIASFKRGAKTDFDAVAAARVGGACGPGSAQVVLRLLVAMAVADGRLRRESRAELERLRRYLGLPSTALGKLLDEVGAPVHETDPYTVLGVPAGAPTMEVERAYRRAMSRHHPDKLAALGLSAAEIDQAAERTIELRQAWVQIRRERGLSA